MSHCISNIKFFYRDIIKTETDVNFNIRDLVKDIHENDLVEKLAELILGVAVGSEKNTYYVDCISKLPEDLSNYLIQIVYELVRKENENDEGELENNKTKNIENIDNNEDLIGKFLINNFKMVKKCHF